MELRIEKEIGRGNLERASEISDKLANALKERGIKIDDTTIVATKFSQHPI
jgi:3-methyladenine DNA glycosylase Tag